MKILPPKGPLATPTPRQGSRFTDAPFIETSLSAEIQREEDFYQGLRASELSPHKASFSLADEDTARFRGIGDRNTRTASEDVYEAVWFLDPSGRRKQGYLVAVDGEMGKVEMAGDEFALVPQEQIRRWASTGPVPTTIDADAVIAATQGVMKNAKPHVGSPRHDLAFSGNPIPTGDAKNPDFILPLQYAASRGLPSEDTVRSFVAQSYPHCRILDADTTMPGRIALVVAADMPPAAGGDVLETLKPTAGEEDCNDAMCQTPSHGVHDRGVGSIDIAGSPQQVQESQMKPGITQPHVAGRSARFDKEALSPETLLKLKRMMPGYTPSEEDVDTQDALDTANSIDAPTDQGLAGPQRSGPVTPQERARLESPASSGRGSRPVPALGRGVPSAPSVGGQVSTRQIAQGLVQHMKAGDAKTSTLVGKALRAWAEADGFISLMRKGDSFTIEDIITAALPAAQRAIPSTFRALLQKSQVIPGVQQSATPGAPAPAGGDATEGTTYQEPPARWQELDRKQNRSPAEESEYTRLLDESSRAAALASRSAASSFFKKVIEPNPALSNKPSSFGKEYAEQTRFKHKPEEEDKLKRQLRDTRRRLEDGKPAEKPQHHMAEGGDDGASAVALKRVVEPAPGAKAQPSAFGAQYSSQRGVDSQGRPGAGDLVHDPEERIELANRVRNTRDTTRRTQPALPKHHMAEGDSEGAELSGADQGGLDDTASTNETSTSSMTYGAKSAAFCRAAGVKELKRRVHPTPAEMDFQMYVERVTKRGDYIVMNVAWPAKEMPRSAKQAVISYVKGLASRGPGGYMDFGYIGKVHVTRLDERKGMAEVAFQALANGMAIPEITRAADDVNDSRLSRF